MNDNTSIHITKTENEVKTRQETFSDTIIREQAKMLKCLSDEAVMSRLKTYRYRIKKSVSYWAYNGRDYKSNVRLMLKAYEYEAERRGLTV